MSETSTYHKSAKDIEKEALLIERAKQNPEQFEVLYNRYYEQIFRYIYQRVSDSQEAKDVCSQVFLKAMNNLANYEHRGLPFSSWLYRIAYSELNQSYREKKAQKTVNIDTQVFSLRDMDDNYEDNSDDLSTLAEVIRELSEEDIQLIEFRYFEKRPVKEVAEILNLSESNVKVKTHRALQKLKTLFNAKIKTYETPH